MYQLKIGAPCTQQSVSEYREAGDGMAAPTWHLPYLAFGVTSFFLIPRTAQSKWEFFGD